MKRRSLVAGLVAGLSLLMGACATSAPAPQAFTSDRIEVVTRGSGADVILIPGLTSHRDVWATTAAALETNHRVHIVQVKGFAGFPAEANAEGPVSASSPKRSRATSPNNISIIPRSSATRWAAPSR